MLKGEPTFFKKKNKNKKTPFPYFNDFTLSSHYPSYDDHLQTS
jgi:hypothetical protein